MSKLLSKVLFGSLSAMALLSACGKAETKCTYRIKVFNERTVTVHQEETVDENGSIIPAKDVQKSLIFDVSQITVHAFYADTAQWAVTSYAHAAAGILTNKADASLTMQADFSDAGTDSYDEKILGPLTRPRIILVVCSAADELYAWRQAIVPENLDRVNIQLSFKPENTNNTYKNGPWTMVNEKIAVPEPGDEK